MANTSSISLDVNNAAALEKEVASHDLVISLVPNTYHAAVIRAAIKGKTHVVTPSYVPPAIRELDEEAKKAGVVVLNEVGLDPGIDHLYAIKTINEVHEKGGKVLTYNSDYTIASLMKVTRSSNSCPIVAAFLPPNAVIIRLVTSSHGPLEESFLRC